MSFALVRWTNIYIFLSYETTSSENSNSEGSSESESEKEGVNARDQVQHADNKAELCPESERAGPVEIQQTASDAAATSMQDCTKRYSDCSDSREQ